MGGPRIQVAQPTEGSTAGSWGMTDIPSVLLLFHCSYSEITVIITEYLAVRPGSAPETEVVVPGMYGTYLKHGQCLQISFNNLGLQLTCMIGVVWDASTACGNWCSLA